MGSLQWSEVRRGGDRRAIDDWLGRHIGSLRAFIRLRAGARILAFESSSDIVQSVCREVLEDAVRYEHRNEAEFRGFLFTVALRKVLDRGRAIERRRRRAEVASFEDPGVGSAAENERWSGYAEAFSPSRRALAREDAERIERAFDVLDDHQREVLLLSRIVGLGRREIAHQTGRSEEAVKKLLARAMARFALAAGEAIRSVPPGRAVPGRCEAGLPDAREAHGDA